MANRAFIIPCRNDLPDGLVQFTDVAPNTSQANGSIGGQGQTGYIDHGHYRGTTWIPPMNVELPVYAGGLITAVTRGLPGWLIDHVQCQGGGGADAVMTPVQARAIAAKLVLRVVAGLSLTHTDIVTVINAVGAMNGTAPALVAWNPALPTATGLRTVACGASKPAAQLVEEIVRILSGEVYEVQALATVATAGGLYSNAGAVVHPAVGSVTGTLASGFLTQPNAAVATQTWPASTNFVNMRTLYLSGSIRASAGGGHLSIFKRTPAATVPFAYNAAIMPNGVTAATYGVANGTTGNVRGSAHSNNFVFTLGAATVAADAVWTATNHPFINADRVRLNGAIDNVTGLASTDAANGNYAVANVVAAVSLELATVDTTVTGNAIAAGATLTLETSATSNHIDIGTNGQFRGVMVYDSEGNVL